MKNWKTTTAGILVLMATAITVAKSLLLGAPLPPSETIMAGFTAGVGLIVAGDAGPAKPAA